MRPRPKWRASSAPFPALRTIASRCCASSATIAAPRMARPRATRSFRSLPVPLDAANCPDPALVAAARAPGTGAGARRAHGYRNAQATVIAPTGTIGLVMDCDTTGIEPDFALVKFKKLAGGGYFRIINRAVPEALRTLGYRPRQIEAITRYAVGHGTLEGRAGAQPRAAQGQGLHRRRARSAWSRRSPPPSTSASPSTSGRSARNSARRRSASPPSR